MFANLMRHRTAGARALAVLLAAAALCWAAVVNGQPFFHPDSIGYVRGPDVAVMKLVGAKYGTAWARFDPGAVDQRNAAKPTGARVASYDDNEVLAGRSIYYGVLTYLGAVTGGFWLTVFIQGLAVAWLTEIALRALSITSLRAYAGVMALLALGTPAPFFTGFLMPDIWAGVAIGTVAILFAAPGRLTMFDRVVLFAMTAFAALAHNSVPLVILGMAVCGGAFWLVRRPAAPRPGLALLGCGLALATGLAGNAAFDLMVRHVSGRPPLMPPFLSARVIADGPGTRFARERCAGAFVVCRYADRFPMSVDDFLWAQGASGVFDGASSADRRALGEEQTRFALAAARAYPLDQALASARNAWTQVFATDLSDFNYKPTVGTSLATRSPPVAARALKASRAYAQAWPLDGIWAEQIAISLASLAIAAALLLRASTSGPRRTAKADPAMVFFALVLTGVLANGVVCGVLSTLYGRYQARVVWTLPLAVAAMAMSAAPIKLAVRRIGLRLSRA